MSEKPLFTEEDFYCPDSKEWLRCAAAAKVANTKTRELSSELARLRVALDEARSILQKADNLKCKHMTDARLWIDKYFPEEKTF